MSDEALGVDVIATEDHCVGPDSYVAVAAGARRTVQLLADGKFWTRSDQGHLFGQCRIGEGWALLPRVETNRVYTEGGGGLLLHGDGTAVAPEVVRRSPGR